MNLVSLMVALPLLAGFGMPLLPRKAGRTADAIALVFAAALLALAVALFAGPADTTPFGTHPAPLGIQFVLDGMSQLMILIIASITFAVMIYTPVYMNRYTGKRRFYALFFLMLAGMYGVVLTGDLFNLFLFLEVASLASYALVAFGCGKDDLEASFKYLMLGTLASYFLLLGIGLIYARTGTLNIAQIGRQLAAESGGLVLREPRTALFALAATLFLCGLGLKAALVPFHAWLPDAHPSAPTPISAMLSGVLVKAIGVYALARVMFTVFALKPDSPLSYTLMALGALSMLVGALLAIGQTDFKRLLAYSSISQIGYIVLALGLATPFGIVAGLFHLANHAVFKSLLFLNAGAVEYRTGSRQLDRMGGLNKRMPATGATGFIGSMSISGVPPFNGFFSKLLIILACFQAGHLVFAVLAIVVSFITLGYFLKVQKKVFFGPLKEKWQGVREVPVSMALAMALLAVLCLATSALVLDKPNEFFFGRARDCLLGARVPPASNAMTTAGQVLSANASGGGGSLDCLYEDGCPADPAVCCPCAGPAARKKEAKDGP